MIPLIDLTLDKKLLDKIKKEVERVIDSKSYILGARLTSFEKKFAEFVGTKYAIGVGSGTDALRLALRACGIGRGDKVLTVSLTSPFTALAIVEEGAIPVFCDVDEDSLTFDVDDAQKRIDKNVRAIIPVHLFGNPCQIDKVLKLAQDFKLKVIEDACQAHGATFGNRRIGSFGMAAAFSFYPTKNLGGFGDGGMVVTSDAKVATKIRSLRHGGQTKRFWHKYAGINSRLDEIQAAILEVKLTNLQEENRQRGKLVKRYTDALGNLPVKFQETLPKAASANHLFVVRTKERDAMQKFLAANGVASDIYYPHPVHLQPAFKKYAQGPLKITEEVTAEILALPLYPSLAIADQNKVTKVIKEFFMRY